MNMRARVPGIVNEIELLSSVLFCVCVYVRCTALGCCTNNNNYATKMMTRKMVFHESTLIFRLLSFFVVGLIVPGKKLEKF